MKKKLITLFLVLCFHSSTICQTIALWTFDEQQGIYPSSVLSDHSDNDYPLVIGNGARIVEGKYGNALDPIKRNNISFKDDPTEVRFGLTKVAIPKGRTVEPLSWYNADFAALMTSGEKHLRNQVGFAQVTKTKLNLGEFDWTVEFWFNPTRNADKPGVVFEIGQGPRAENEFVTSLLLSTNLSHFTLINQPSDSNINIATDIKNNQWTHLAFVYDYDNQQLHHYCNGKLQNSVKNVKIKSLAVGEEDYMSIGRNGSWENPLQGQIDELRFSNEIIYNKNFTVPSSFSYLLKQTAPLKYKEGLPLLFENETEIIQLGTRKHLFIDDSILLEFNDIKFVVNPPLQAENVLTGLKGPFRKHLNVLEDEEGNIRIYTTVDDDYLAVWISKDGINFESPILPKGIYKNNHNIVLHSKVGMGMVFIDPNAPKSERYKYISDYHRRAVSLFYSEDGFKFSRYKQPILPFRSGSQCNIFYDDQKQLYSAFHRSDFGRTKTGDTQRDFVMTETKDILKPWPFEPVHQDQYESLSRDKRVADLQPWYLDNGPLTPGGFALEYPWIFSPIDSLDPRETDVYVPKVLKYPWAPDTYLAFPIVYYHYENSVPLTRRILEQKQRKRGSGPLETQISVSRNGIDWKRYPRPTYVGIGKHAGIDFKTAYIAHGMIKRGNEIWQYYFGEPHYHSPWNKIPEERSVIRLVQRLDGFISIDSPYEKEAFMVTKPLIFDGNELVLNVDTDAAGYLQVGFLDLNDNPIEGFELDDCIYINGDFIETSVEWMKNRDEIKRISSYDEEDPMTLAQKVITSSDISSLNGKTIKLIFRMRGSKLYSMQFR